MVRTYGVGELVRRKVRAAHFGRTWPGVVRHQIDNIHCRATALILTEMDTCEKLGGI